MCKLTEAVRNGDQEQVNKLIDNGADVNAKDEKDEPVLIDATTRRNNEIRLNSILEEVAKLEATSMSLPDLIEKVVLGDAKAVTRLLANGADVNTKGRYDDHDGLTALFLAATLGYKEIVKILLRHGADVNAKTNKGLTALNSASNNGHKEVVNLLLENGADANANKCILQRITKRLKLVGLFLLRTLFLGTVFMFCFKYLILPDTKGILSILGWLIVFCTIEIWIWLRSIGKRSS